MKLTLQKLNQINSNGMKIVLYPCEELCKTDTHTHIHAHGCIIVAQVSCDTGSVILNDNSPCFSFKAA